MSQDSIGAVTTGQGKLQEWKTTQKQNLSRKSRGTLTVKWAGSRDKIFSPGRGRTFFLTSLFIELIDREPVRDERVMEQEARSKRLNSLQNSSGRHTHGFKPTADVCAWASPQKCRAVGLVAAVKSHLMT